MMFVTAFPLINQMQSAFEGVGSLELVALGIMAFFLIVLLIVGLDFRFAVMLVSPLVLAFSDVGWFPKWVGLTFMFVVVGIGLYILWNIIRER